MKKWMVVALCATLVASLASVVSAREVAKERVRMNRAESRNEFTESQDPGLRGFYEASAVDTYFLVWYTFETNSWQGWSRLDRTAQKDTFFHVDDFFGLGGGNYGRLVPIAGAKSMWCGVRANAGDPYLCGWLAAPGYGDNWVQDLQTSAFTFAGAITWSYHGIFDSEAGFDYTYVQYDAGGGNWQTLATYDNVVDTIATEVITTTQARTKLRFRFVADGGFSDEDGNWNSDGAAILDNITVRDAGGLINNTETFETARVNATDAGIWHARPGSAYGTYSGLKNNLIDKDPCGDNFSTQVVFFIGSPNPSSSYPGLYDTPFCQGTGGTTAPCQNDYIVSPVIDMTKYSTAKNTVQNGTIPAGDLPLLGGTLLEYTVYRDLALSNLVFYEEYVRNIVDGCPGPWLNDSWVYYGENQDYIYSAYNVSHLVFADKIQIALTCRDMCDIWYLQYGNCASHTPSPWFDNVRVERYKTSGPQWSYRDIELFQDNFPENEFNIESYVRADAAVDINNQNDPITRPGDSIVIQCTAPLAGGLALDGGHPAIYMHVKATYIGRDHAKPAQLAGPQLQGTYGYYKSDDGTWTIIQGDTATVSGQTVNNWFMFDLNDSLFTRGYKIEYYFQAKDLTGIESKWPRHLSAGGAANNLQEYNEFTCLPTKNSDILYVDDFGERPDYFLIGQVEAYWQPVFQAVLPANNQPDVYDVQGSASAVSNGPGSRAKTKQLTDQYNTIVWDSGNLSIATITDGTVNSDKSNDCAMLIDWMTLSEHRCGLWVCGDDVASDLDAMASTPALTLMSTWCGVDFAANGFFNETGGRTGGGIVTPLIKGDPSGIFTHAGVPDQFYAYGGCFIINQFDVLDKTANGKYALTYPMYQSTNRYAGIQSTTVNSAGFEARTMWFGFSFMYMRNDATGAPIDRFHIAADVFGWFQNPVNIDVTPADPTPKFTKLTQNFPNPFNPSTTIKFDLKDKGLVTLKVYNVAGQLVKTLVNGEMDATTHSITWNGTNDRGGAVASGIYFYKMDTKDFSQTKKMVMLR
jgi:hypothetical protein